MSEPTIIYPNCKTEIWLTESLAAPPIAATRQQFEQQLAQKDEDIAKCEQGFSDKVKQWAKREEQIERVMSATVGMYGDLQGIAGKSLQEIEGFAFPAITDASGK